MGIWEMVATPNINIGRLQLPLVRNRSTIPQV
jgi:hypothetical protein